jgi:hypothetical protein
MKSIVRNLALLTAFFVIATAGMPKDKNPITGNYRLVKAVTDGQPNNEMVMNRTMRYNDDNTFSGKITIQNQEMPSNQGKYFVENDSMLIMHQSTIKGELFKIAFVYNYKITGDTLNIKGFYAKELMGGPAILKKFYIDESWVRINEK